MHAYPETPLSGHVAESLSYGRLRVMRRVLPSNVRLPKHRHPCAILTIVTKGTFEERMLYRTDECTAGDMRYQPANEPHTNRFWKKAQCIQFELNAAWVKQIEEATGRFLFAGALKGAQFCHLARRLASEAECLRTDSGLVIEPLLIEILSQAVATSGSNRAGQPVWLERIREMIIESSGGHVTLAQLAASAGVHPVHLCRAFHRHYHCTIGDMIRKVRLQRACQALRRGQPLVDVALSCGFSDQSHLCRLFRRELGVTPAEYRATAKRSALREQEKSGSG